MSAGWTPAQLQRIAASRELEITTRRADGSLHGWLPIWVVRAGDELYVRTWYRRSSGWFGRALAAGQARVRVPGVESEVAVEDVGAGDTSLRAAVDTAYADKYGGGPDDRMVGEEAAATTLRLTPVTEPA